MGSFLRGLRQHWPSVPLHRKILLAAVTLLGIVMVAISWSVAAPAWAGDIRVPGYALIIPFLFALMLIGWIGDSLSHIAYKPLIAKEELLVHDMLLYSANLPSWLSYFLALWLGDALFALSLTFVILKIGYASYDEFRFHWKRALPGETLVHYTLFLSILALDITWLRWIYFDALVGFWPLFGL